MKELEVFLDKSLATFLQKPTKETNPTTSVKPEQHLQCIKVAVES